MLQDCCVYCSPPDFPLKSPLGGAPSYKVFAGMGHGLEMNQILKFGPFEVDLAVRQLTQSGQPVPLTPKVFQTLEILVRNRDRVVSKRELLTTIWPECHVEEANLTQNISVLRKALGETSCPTKYIVTFP